MRPATHHGPWCEEGSPCGTCFNLAEDRRQETILPAIAALWQAPHPCNYASRYRMTMCNRRVTDGERYCYQHR